MNSSHCLKKTLSSCTSPLEVTFSYLAGYIKAFLKITDTPLPQPISFGFILDFKILKTRYTWLFLYLHFGKIV